MAKRKLSKIEFAEFLKNVNQAYSIYIAFSANPSMTSKKSMMITAQHFEFGPLSINNGFLWLRFRQIKFL